MAFHIKRPETEALARKVAAMRNVGLTDAVHTALERELERETGKPALVETGLEFVRNLKRKGKPTQGLPADKAFRDGLYERS